MVMPPAIYALRSNTPWTYWPDPGPHPEQAGTTAEQNNIRVIYEPTRPSSTLSVPNAFRKPIGNQIGIGTKVYTVRDDPQTILTDLRTKYGTCTPSEKAANGRRFDEP